MRKIFNLILSSLLFMIPFGINAEPLEIDGYDPTDENIVDTVVTLPTDINSYDIKNYDVDLDLSIDHVLTVKEVIQLHFNTNDNCIIKYIPVEGYINRKDNTNAYFKMELKKFKSNYTYEINKTKYDYKVFICTDSVNNEDKTLILDYKLYFDNSLNGEFNYNILDNRIPAKIDKLTYEINYPKEFSSKKLSMYYNYFETNNYKVDGYKVSGTITDLKENSSVIIKSVLNNDYFIKRNDHKEYNIFIVITLLLNTFIVFLIWLKNGKDFKKLNTVELKPFGNYNPLELGFIETECQYATDKMIFSLIIYLANKGYIKMDRKFDSITLTKLKDYDGNNEIERVLMKRLFINSKEFNYYNGNKEYKKIEKKIRSLIDTRENRNSIMEKQNILVKIVPYILGVINVLLTLYLVLYGRSALLITITSVLTIVGFTLFTYALTISNDEKQIAVMWIAVLLIFLSGIETTFDILTNNFELLLYYFFGVMSFCIIVMFIFLMPKRSKDGNLRMSRAINFKEFLKNPNPELLSMLVKENKKYVYDVISYAYAFNVEGDFLDNYTRLFGYIKEPKWYKDHTE